MSYDRAGKVKPSRARRWVLSTLGVAALFACLPVRDLSDYASAGRDAVSSAAPTPDPGDTLVPDPGDTLVPDPGEAVEPMARLDLASPAAKGTHHVVVPLSTRSPKAPTTPSATAVVEKRGVDAGGARALADAGQSAPDEPLPLRCALGESTAPSGHCYALVSDELNWAAARNSCQSRGPGWDLASIRTEADSNFLGSLLREEMWVGGSDARTEATWTWVDDGVEFWQGEDSGVALNGAFVNWFGTEPNGAFSSDCLRLLLGAGWADYECEELIGSICQGPPG